ncbi:MAG: T9SS type A sorting domain-containing protein, partial [Bacteroidales bacterium]|nr:T9SS type A sorting domain-containing protein [Bacteroidales bacterium]
HNGATGNLSARYIQPGQAFFIEATGNATQFTITTADRVQNIQPYMKNMVPYVLKLFTEGGNESSDEVYISFKEGDDITAAYDINHDARDWQSYFPSFATELYTVSSDEVDLAIDTRPMLLGDEVSVPLHFKPTVDAEYNIIADEESMNSFPPSISIMLEDTFEPQLDWIDLRMEGSYTFDALKWAPRDRFILHFYDIAFGIDDGMAYEPIKIYSDRTDAFIINDSEQLIKEINVYDISGNLMDSRTTVNAAHTRIFVSDRTGYYVVKVVTDKAVYTEKVLITK